MFFLVLLLVLLLLLLLLFLPRARCCVDVWTMSHLELYCSPCTSVGGFEDLQDHSPLTMVRIVECDESLTSSYDEPFIVTNNSCVCVCMTSGPSSPSKLSTLYYSYLYHLLKCYFSICLSSRDSEGLLQMSSWLNDTCLVICNWNGNQLQSRRMKYWCWHLSLLKSTFNED